MKHKILLVDDDSDILEFLSYNLLKEGYSIERATNGKEALVKTKIFKPDLILMDIMMPEMDGIVACEEIRQNINEDVIIVFLTARGEDFSQIAGYEAGGDDYITKPVKPKVLISKIKSLLRRKNNTTGVNTKSQNTVLELPGNITIDVDRYIVLQDGKELFFPKKEFELLKLLASNPEKVFHREEIYSLVWGETIIVGERTIDVHIRKIRKKLGNDIIKTVKGVGYCFSG